MLGWAPEKWMMTSGGVYGSHMAMESSMRWKRPVNFSAMNEASVCNTWYQKKDIY